MPSCEFKLRIRGSICERSQKKLQSRVNVKAIESLIIPAISPFNDSLIIIDEIGLMQCHAPHFLDAVTTALNNAPCVLGTISLQNTEKILAIKHRSDVQIIEVTSENRNSLPEIILHHLSLKNDFSPSAKWQKGKK